MTSKDSSNISTSACLRWLWHTSLGFRLRIVCSGLIGIFHAGISLFFVWVSKRLVDIATGEVVTDLYPYIGLLLGCILCQLACSTVRSRLDTYTEIRLTNTLRHQLFTRLMNSRWMGKEALHTGDILNRLEGDVNLITSTLCRTLPACMATGIQLIAAFLFLAQMEIRLAFLLLVIMPIALLVSKVYIRQMRHLTKEIRTSDSHVQAHLQEHLQHRTLLSTLEQTDGATNELSDIQGKLQQQVMRRNTFSLFSRSMVQIGFSTGYITAFLWGIFGLHSGAVTFGMMTAFLQLVAQVQRPIVELSRLLPTFIHATASIERLVELADMPLEEQGTPIKLTGDIGIRLEDVSFAYPDGKRTVINHFSHNFTPGSLTALLGETGVGKSTLIRLMLALLLPDKGRITFYNKETEVNASPLTRCNIVYVPQGNTLISGTVRENLLLGNPKASDSELHAVLHTAVADFVFSLPDGLDTLCGELGTGLSEGQAQRIAIARALLRPGGILLLDEPTSSLDLETERLLLQRLSDSIQEKTLILVTHRETIAQLCTTTIRLTK